MSDEHHRDIVELVAERLAELTMSGAAFDHEAIATDYSARLEMDATLDELIGSGDVDDPLAFDPRDPH